jgi:hypothetical protein
MDDKTIILTTRIGDLSITGPVTTTGYQVRTHPVSRVELLRALISGRLVARIRIEVEDRS